MDHVNLTYFAAQRRNALRLYTRVSYTHRVCKQVREAAEVRTGAFHADSHVKACSRDLHPCPTVEALRAAALRPFQR